MEEVYLSICCDVFYVADKNVVLVHWKEYCELEQYREPLMKALQVINAHNIFSSEPGRHSYLLHKKHRSKLTSKLLPSLIRSSIIFTADCRQSLVAISVPALVIAMPTIMSFFVTVVIAFSIGVVCQITC